MKTVIQRLTLSGLVVTALATLVLLGSESSLRAQSTTDKSNERQASKKELAEAEKAERELKRLEERGAIVNPYKSGRTMTMSRPVLHSGQSSSSSGGSLTVTSSLDGTCVVGVVGEDDD